MPFHKLRELERVKVAGEMAGDEPAFRWQWGGEFWNAKAGMGLR